VHAYTDHTGLESGTSHNACQTF